MLPEFDVIVIGSGAAGVHAAHPLVTAGLRVLMLDGGVPAPAILQEPPPGGFLDMRKRSYDQTRWFVGEDPSELPAQTEMNGMIGGNRDFVTRHRDATSVRRHNEDDRRFRPGGPPPCAACSETRSSRTIAAGASKESWKKTFGAQRRRAPAAHSRSHTATGRSRTVCI